MEITKVSFGKTFNTGNFRSERYDMEATLNPGERPADVINGLRILIDETHNHAHGIPMQPSDIPFFPDDDSVQAMPL